MRDGRSFGGFRPGCLAGQVELGLDLGKGERDSARVPEGRQSVDPWPSRIAEAEKLGDLVIGLAGGVVQCAANEGVLPGVGNGLGEVKMGVAAGDDQGQSRIVVWSLAIPGLNRIRSEPWSGTRGAGSLRGPCLPVVLTLVEQHGVDVAFQMVDGDQR